MLFDQLLTTAVLLLGASTVAIVLFHRAGFGSVLGLLATGVVLGPHTPGPVIDIGPLTAATELGVVFLLFVIGLELEPRRLWAMRRAFFGLGTLQMVLSGAALAGAALVAGQPWRAALILGLGLALSSTAFVLQLLSERDELGSEHGRTAFAILLLQDIAVVPLLALVPFLAPGPAGDAAAVSPGPRLLLTLATVLGIVAFGGLLLPRAFAMVARQRSAEGFALMAALSVLVAAWVTHHAGLSPALGAFLLGVVLSQSPFHHQIGAEISPFKGMLLGLFFISVGMAIDIGLLLQHWPRILVAVLVLILLKGVVILALCRLFGLHAAAALRTALLMTQGGEFGFVLFAAAAGAGIIGSELHTTALLVISVSMAATPLLARLGDWLARHLPRAPGPTVEQAPDRHVVIAGFGRVGRAVAAMLDGAGVPYVALDLDLTRVLVARKAGRPVFYGDASDPLVLDRAGTGRAAALVITLDKASAAERIVTNVRSFYPGIPVVVRGHDAALGYRLERLGASIVVPETLELSLTLGRALLQRLGCSEDMIEEAARTVRERHRQTAE
ncbi:cation:proton antiporter [Benzoatithermus flavus]|uniref:Cation:proton antiporter n=1 Tax=Benzoatithermus flavus TaxID=3108223 RepID=A0ABU8XYV9_9PROT